MSTITTYRELLRLSLEHPFYPGDRCTGVSIVPTADTLHLLERRRCFVRHGVNDVTVVTGSAPLSPKELLRFDLVLRNPEFLDVTELDFSLSAHDAVYSNEDDPRVMELKTGPDKAPGVMARVEIHLEGARPTVELSIFFRPKSVHWIYYCLFASRGPAGNEADVITLEGPASAPLTFTKHVGTDPEDAVLEGLLERHPGLAVVRFATDQALECSPQPKELELKLVQPGGEIRVCPLPNPPFRNATSFRVPTDQNHGCIFQIINLSNPIGTTGG